MVETTTVFFVDTAGSQAYHFDENCPHLTEATDAEVQTSALYHSRRVGSAKPVKERYACRRCQRERRREQRDD